MFRRQCRARLKRTDEFGGDAVRIAPSKSLTTVGSSNYSMKEAGMLGGERIAVLPKLNQFAVRIVDMCKTPNTTHSDNFTNLDDSAIRFLKRCVEISDSGLQHKGMISLESTPCLYEKGKNRDSLLSGPRLHGCGCWCRVNSKVCSIPFGQTAGIFRPEEKSTDAKNFHHAIFQT